MILQSLLAYYEALADKDLIPRYGWSRQKVSYALEINRDGELIACHPLTVEEQRGKKTLMVPREMEVPTPFVRTSGSCSNFLCDNAKYFLGVDIKKEARGLICFKEAKKRHESILSDVDSEAAQAVLAYFRTFDCGTAKQHPVLADAPDDLWSTANLVFLYKGEFVMRDTAVTHAWTRFFSSSSDEDDKEEKLRMCCLLTGEITEPQATHSPIKGVPGAQSTGAAVVSFNAPADCSYEREQNLNAPIGKYGAFSYTTALNYLIADKRHNKLFGDTLLLYWADDAETAYQDVFSAFLNADRQIVSDDDLNVLMEKISHGRTFEWNNALLNPQNHFCILGISPNASRLSVRLFWQDTFGVVIAHLKEHYDRLSMIPDQLKLPQMLPLWRLLNETVNQNAKDKTASPQLAGDMLRAILTGGQYPATMYQQLQLRIRADRKINHVRAAMIKAYLIKNMYSEDIKEALTMELNDKTTYQPYILGLLFAVLERIQERASNVTTIKDKYFTSASSTPAAVFPLIVDLAGKHLRKMGDGERIYYEKMLQSLLCLVTESYPSHHTLTEQGVFQLGYYHQVQKFYEKKTTEEAPNNESTNNI